MGEVLVGPRLCVPLSWRLPPGHLSVRGTVFATFEAIATAAFGAKQNTIYKREIGGHRRSVQVNAQHPAKHNHNSLITEERWY